MKTLRKTLVTSAFVFGASILTLAPSFEALAGELVPRPRRIFLGGGGTQGRVMRRSTVAVRRLSSARSSRPMSLKESNPYEARIAAISREQRVYAAKVDRYEHRIESQEVRIEQRSRRSKQRELDRQNKKIERLQDKERREQLKLARDKQKSSTSATRALFGSSKSSQDPLGQEIDVTADTNRRPTLWQRLKGWLFGNSNGGAKSSPL